MDQAESQTESRFDIYARQAERARLAIEQWPPWMKVWAERVPATVELRSLAAPRGYKRCDIL
jgi:hypothetical protein